MIRQTSQKIFKSKPRSAESKHCIKRGDDNRNAELVEGKRYLVSSQRTHRSLRVRQGFMSRFQPSSKAAQKSLWCSGCILGRKRCLTKSRMRPTKAAENSIFTRMILRSSARLIASTCSRIDDFEKARFLRTLKESQKTQFHLLKVEEHSDITMPLEF